MLFSLFYKNPNLFVRDNGRSVKVHIILQINENMQCYSTVKHENLMFLFSK